MKISNLKNDSGYSVLRQWCLTICNYLLSVDKRFSIFICGKDSFLSVLEDIDRTRNLRKIRALYKELNIMAGEILSSKQMDDLNQLLKEKFGHNIADEKDKETEIIQKIIKRGKIRNDREFELVKCREEEIWEDDSQIEYAETLRRMMGDYEVPEV
jgi:polyhydroxyalkanoate synthesis regulator phasin